MTYKVLIISIEAFVKTGQVVLIYLCNLPEEQLFLEKNCVQIGKKLFQSATVLAIPTDVNANVKEGDSVYVEEVIA